jgi:hypothetical protein
MARREEHSARWRFWLEGVSWRPLLQFGTKLSFHWLFTTVEDLNFALNVRLGINVLPPQIQRMDIQCLAWSNRSVSGGVKAARKLLVKTLRLLPFLLIKTQSESRRGKQPNGNGIGSFVTCIF